MTKTFVESFSNMFFFSHFFSHLSIIEYSAFTTTMLVSIVERDVQNLLCPDAFQFHIATNVTVFVSSLTLDLAKM